LWCGGGRGDKGTRVCTTCCYLKAEWLEVKHEDFELQVQQPN